MVTVLCMRPQQEFGSLSHMQLMLSPGEDDIYFAIYTSIIPAI
jgi:hypothetical protein